MVSVRDVMTAPPVTVPLDATPAFVTKVLETQKLSAVPVVDREGRLAGIISTTDLVRELAQRGGAVSASSLMTAPVVIASPTESLDEAAWRLVAARIHRLVVTENDRPIGVLSVRDILAEVRRRHIDTPIRSIMSTPVETISIGDTIRAAITRLASAGVHGLVVVDRETPLGVFTHAEALEARRLPEMLLEDPVEQVMSYETICLDASTSIHHAAGHATAMNVRRILVAEGGRLVGVLSAVDLVGVLARLPEENAPARGTP